MLFTALLLGAALASPEKAAAAPLPKPVIVLRSSLNCSARVQNAGNAAPSLNQGNTQADLGDRSYRPTDYPEAGVYSAIDVKGLDGCSLLVPKGVKWTDAVAQSPAPLVTPPAAPR